MGLLDILAIAGPSGCLGLMAGFFLGNSVRGRLDATAMLAHQEAVSVIRSAYQASARQRPKTTSTPKSDDDGGEPPMTAAEIDAWAQRVRLMQAQEGGG